MHTDPAARDDSGHPHGVSLGVGDGSSNAHDFPGLDLGSLDYSHYSDLFHLPPMDMTSSDHNSRLVNNAVQGLPSNLNVHTGHPINPGPHSRIAINDHMLNAELIKEQLQRQHQLQQLQQLQQQILQQQIEVLTGQSQYASASRPREISLHGLLTPG
ncbi:hypothetical protein BOTBODRAFT_529714 [Botryobasidium botryosum FD-172 SS1]|uniref:Uncharacterized protein n=1 Tax=Botryobasidium botryosum (strain FD-172 SS1) TaxID=930990 RepID=A0A067MCS8_BOTB1|nr:hypothetical protein BOTBODRAFT_529714 [Botryobasidium botryosum FD-172 SS1]